MVEDRGVWSILSEEHSCEGATWVGRTGWLAGKDCDVVCVETADAEALLWFCFAACIHSDRVLGSTGHDAAESVDDTGCGATGVGVVVDVGIEGGEGFSAGTGSAFHQPMIAYCTTRNAID